MSFLIDLSSGKETTINYMLYNNFELFFFWHIFFAFFVGGLKQFCKNITVKEGLIAKSVTEKNNEGLIVRKPQKRPCKP